MEFPRLWTTFFCIIYLLLLDACIFCQHVPPEIVTKQVFSQSPVNDKNIQRDFPNTSKPSSKAQFMNTLLSLVSNGVLPETTSPVVSTGRHETPFKSNSIDEIPRSFNIVTLPPQTPSFFKEPGPFNVQPSANSNLVPNMVFHSPSQPATYVPLKPMQPTTPIEPISFNNNVITAPQVIPVQSYGAPSQSLPTVWQMPQSINNGYNYVPITPISYTELSPSAVNLQISPPSSILPEIYTDSGVIEILSEPALGNVVQEPIIMNDYNADGFPLNLQINVPSQSTPAPRITVVTTKPEPVTRKEPEFGTWSNFGTALPPPIIMRSSRSCWKKLLPIVLLALINDLDSPCGTCCCCNCGSDSQNSIPIPYPIPIPVNNPIINNSGSSFSSREREQRSNGNKNG